MAPSLCVTVAAPQPSVAVALPSAASIAAALGLQPSDVAVPEAVINGGVLSAVHDTVLKVVALLPHASLAVKVLVCVYVQEAVLMAPSLCVTLVVTQPSVAVADPSAALMSAPEGLHCVSGKAAIVITGGVISTVLVIV